MPMSPNRKRVIANSGRQGSCILRCFNIYPATKYFLIFRIYAQVSEVIKVTDDEEWEFDTPQPSWLKKLIIEKRSLLISKDDPITMYKSSLN